MGQADERQLTSPKPGSARDAAVRLFPLPRNRYQSHAQFEEQEFLPLARQILGRDGNHLAALGLALHMRHVPLPVGYI